MSGANKFSGEGQGKIHNVVIAKEQISTISREKVEPNDKVTPSEEVQKGTNISNDMKEPVHKIRRKDLDQF